MSHPHTEKYGSAEVWKEVNAKYGPKTGGSLAAPTGSTTVTFKARIDATHPMHEYAPTGALEADALAMQLVGERHGKRDLVDLVRWLILRNPLGLLSND